MVQYRQKKEIYRKINLVETFVMLVCRYWLGVKNLSTGGVITLLLIV